MLKKWCLQIMVLEKTPESTLDSKEIIPILREINPEYLLEGLMLKLKLQYFGLLMQTADSWKSPWCWERWRAETEEGIRGWNGWMASSMQWTRTWANFRRWWGTGRPGMLKGSMRLQSQTRLGDWRTNNEKLWFLTSECVDVKLLGHTVTPGLPWGLSGRESTCRAEDAGDRGSIPGLGRSIGGGNGNPLQYSCLGNSMDRRAWRATVHGVPKSQTQLND